jgi:hypothetical protein
MAVVIYHEHTGIKRYVEKVDKTATNLFLFEFTTDINNAKDFGNVLKATETLAKHINSYNRKYKVVSTDSKKEQTVPKGLFVNEKKLLR